MSHTLPSIKHFLDQCGHAYEIWPCEPELAESDEGCIDAEHDHEESVDGEVTLQQRDVSAHEHDHQDGPCLVGEQGGPAGVAKTDEQVAGR